MKFRSVANAALLAASVKAGCSYDDGNYYCSETDAVVYSNVGYSGTYYDVTDMDETTCECTQEEVSFSGSITPLNEELSVHFRGPINLLEFAVYYPDSGVTLAKRGVADEDDVSCTSTQAAHHKHKREAAIEWVEVTSTIVVDAEGNTIVAEAQSTTTAAADSTTTSTSSDDTTTSLDVVAAEVVISATGTTSSTSTSTSSSSTTTSSTSASTTSSTSSSTSTGSGWSRVAHFVPDTTSNVTFMNHLGGVTDSGVWSSCFGNSISYCASDGTSASSSAEALGNVTVASDTEFIIFSGESCDDSSIGDCGYYRDDIPAYHGFGGATKIFVFEFSMPTDNTGTNNVDMPAVWLLNAKIPRTLQYGDSSCSCWSTGCGELDLFEVLSTGSDKLITTLHDGQGNDGTSNGGGGSSDYFDRPTSGSLKAAVIFDGDDESIHIVEVSDSFDSTLSADTVNAWYETSGSSVTLSS